MTESQKQVYDLIDIYGPINDQALVPLAQHLGQISQSSSGLRSRRAELVRKGHVVAVDIIKLPSGRSAALWATAPQ